MVSPTVLKEQGGDDFAQSYLSTHDAGTGPFTITDFELGTKYVVDRVRRLLGREAAGHVDHLQHPPRHLDPADSSSSRVS